MYACILIFFVTNMVEGQLISTGAFEVSLNGMYSLTCLLHITSIIVVLYTYTVAVLSTFLHFCSQICRFGPN